MSTGSSPPPICYHGLEGLHTLDGMEAALKEASLQLLCHAGQRTPIQLSGYWLNIIWCCFIRSQFSIALEYIGASLQMELDPEVKAKILLVAARIWHLGSAPHLAPDRGQAFEFYNQALALNLLVSKWNLEIRYCQAAILIHDLPPVGAKLDQALAIVNVALGEIGLSLNFRVIFLHLRSDIYRRLKQQDLELADTTEAIEICISTKRPIFLYNRALTYRKQGKHELAMSDYIQALSEPNLELKSKIDLLQSRAFCELELSNVDDPVNAQHNPNISISSDGSNGHVKLALESLSRAIATSGVSPEKLRRLLIIRATFNRLIRDYNAVLADAMAALKISNLTDLEKGMFNFCILDVNWLGANPKPARVLKFGKQIAESCRGVGVDPKTSERFRSYALAAQADIYSQPGAWYQPEEAKKLLDQVLSQPELLPEWLQALCYCHRGRLAYQEVDWTTCLANYDRTLAWEPRIPAESRIQIFHHRAQIYRQGGGDQIPIDLAAAHQDHLAILNLTTDPAEIAQFSILCGDYHVQYNRNFRHALLCYNRALECPGLDPGVEATAYFRRAQIWYFRQQWSLASYDLKLAGTNLPAEYQAKVARMQICLHHRLDGCTQSHPCLRCSEDSNGDLKGIGLRKRDTRSEPADSSARAGDTRTGDTRAGDTRAGDKRQRV